MNVQTRKSGSCRVQVAVRVEAAEARPDYDALVDTFSREGRIPGFRPGKAPRAVVEHHYRREIDGEVRRILISKYYRRAIEQEKLVAVAVLDVTDVLCSPEMGIAFTVVVDVAPEFKLPKYTKIPLKIETPVATDEQVAAQIDHLRRLMSRFEDAPEGHVLARGDLACIDYTATCDGAPLKTVCADGGGLAEATDFWAPVDEPEFIPGVALALEGLTRGADKEIKVKFEKDFRVEALRGRKAVYAVHVKNVRRRLPPTDADVCQRVGMADLEALRARTRQDLQAALERQEKERQRQEVIEFLVKRTPFDLPASVVAEETQLTVRSMLRDIAGRGATREDLEKNRDAILGAATTAAQDRVRLRYILARVAEEAQVKATDAEVEARLVEMAGQYRQPVEKLRATIEERHGLESLRADLRAEKALDMLVADAKAR